jgi:hypothetical protein
MNLSKNGQLSVAAVVAVALAAGGGAFAATKLHTSPRAQMPHDFGRSLPAGYGGPFGFPGARHGGLEAAATYLGLSTTQLFQDLRSGKTLAQVADATSGKSAGGLVSAMVAAAKQRLDEAVRNGELTQAQADRVGANIEARITAMVNGEGFRGPPGGGNGFGFGPGGGDGGPASPHGSSPPPNQA